MVSLECAWIRTVMIYTGHGPYVDHVPQQVAMFKDLNSHRIELGRPEWKVRTVSGELLIGALQAENPASTLLVIPPGPSRDLENAFSQEQFEFIRSQFLKKNGGRLYTTCGSSYMVSKWREYQMAQNIKSSMKESIFPLFTGTAKGPLCLDRDVNHNVNFYSDVVTVANEKETCRMFLSGGGSFFLDENDLKTRVVAIYLDSKLSKNAAIISFVGKGSVLLSMFHPEYGPEHIDIETLRRVFPHSCTNWKEIKERLSPTDDRLRFVFRHMFLPLEG